MKAVLFSLMIVFSVTTLSFAQPVTAPAASPKAAGVPVETKPTLGGSVANSEHEKEKIKLLNDSAAALTQSNPALAAGLTKYAVQEANEMVEKSEGKKEEAKDEAMEQAQRAAHIKLLRDSAAALQAGHADLAERLTKMADRHSAMKMKTEEKTEKTATVK